MRKTENRKRNRRPESKLSLPVIILNILTGIGVLIFITGIFLLREEMKSYDYSIFEKSRITYSVEDHAYGRIVDSYYENAPHMKPSKDVDLEAVALAEYIDASLQKGIYEAAGQQDNAAKQEKRMEETRLKTGIYQGELSHIDLNIQNNQGPDTLK